MLLPVESYKMIKTTAFIAFTTVASTISAFTWVPGVVEGGRDYMVQPAVSAVNALAQQHNTDMKILQVEIATSLHRAIESAEVRTRIVKYELELIKLERDLRKSASPDDKDTIRRSIERLEKSIEREIEEQSKLKGLTKTQISGLLRSTG